jgi:ADP-heptose:LPS heptosyltransferase
LKSTKILAIQFKYLGDAVILTPALKALVTQKTNAELHVLVAAEVAPLLENLPWIKKVWAMPRHRGKLKLSLTLPFIRALRREKFDQSIDFGGNDRGALMSYLVGAHERLGSTNCDDPKLMQRICYTQIVKHKNSNAPYFDLHFELLNIWNIKRPNQLKMEIASKSFDADPILKNFPNNSIICHITTSQPKKDWPLVHWQTLYHLCRQAGLKIVFSAGPNDRERKLLDELRLLAPDADFFPLVDKLSTFLSILKLSKLFVSGDTGPFHFAEGLGVPVLGIFGVGNSIRQVAPMYSEDKIICSDGCLCDSMKNNTNICPVPKSCMLSIKPEAVFEKMEKILKVSDNFINFL